MVCVRITSLRGPRPYPWALRCVLRGRGARQARNSGRAGALCPRETACANGPALRLLTVLQEHPEQLEGSSVHLDEGQSQLLRGGV